MYHASQFVAHRGYARHFPENTLTAFTGAIRAGALFIELDIQFSQDGQPIIYHDDNLQRVSAESGKVFDFTLEQLLQKTAHEPNRFADQFKQVPISSLEELVHMMDVRRQIYFFLELKEESIEHFGAHYCLKTMAEMTHSVADRFTLISFDLPAMRLAKTDYGFSQTGIVFRDWGNREQLISESLADIAYINIERIDKHEAITASCPIVVYEIDQPALAVDALQRGASKVETFAIGELVESLCKQNTML